MASSVGALPELVGAAGLLVEPRDPDPAGRGAAGDLGRRPRPRRAWPPPPATRAESERRTWADVARETRAVYADVGIAGPLSREPRAAA